MSDRMRVLPFDQLIFWMLKEYEKEKSIFGIPEHKFFRKSSHKNLMLFGHELESPLGPAAGPNTQLTQNIIASYCAGCRFFELKTVQVIDGEDLPVSKPCILARDEGYNVEWSTELTVSDALKEYIKAWFALNILSKEFSLGSNNGFIFNMSVGYDLKGIQTQKLDTFIEGLKDASQTSCWNECRDFLLANLSLFQHVDEEYVCQISPDICQSITLSTLHGCPPEEIERIATYLLKEKKLHTYIKCNPTLLGYEFSRNTLNQLGYSDLKFDDHHFQKDLQFDEAVPMIARLQSLAKELKLTFGVKLSNTFPVRITNNELPGEEMYLSGKPLYPLTINLAYRLAKAFDGEIKISYSGGADYFNINKIHRTGIWPITLATTILKPGGYLRLKQLAEELETEDMTESKINIAKLQSLADEAISDTHHHRSRQGAKSHKINKKVPLLDCTIAPCKYGCPIGQDIPEYIRLVGEGRYKEALELILSKNPLPFITGTLCNHRCMTKCNRLTYEEPIQIRDVKLLAAQNAFGEIIRELKVPEITSSFRVAVIGGGPAGLSGAYFLAKQGIDVTVFEKREEIGGVIQHIAPEFRISREAIRHDMDLIRKMGVRFRLGVTEDFSIEDLKAEGFQYIFIAIGAWKPGLLKLESCDKEIMNVLKFLEDYHKSPELLKLGKNVAVIGAGNSAMDAARAAKRVPGVEKVSIIYRRTNHYMPADPDELRLAMKEGVEWYELLAPVSYTEGILRCQRMKLGPSDAAGRRSPVALDGEFIEFKVDYLISAIGEQVETVLFRRNKIDVDVNGRIRVNPETNETSIKNVFIGGDALRGPATIVEAIADGRKFADMIIEREMGQKLMTEEDHDLLMRKQIEEPWKQQNDFAQLTEEVNRQEIEKQIEEVGMRIKKDNNGAEEVIKQIDEASNQMEKIEIQQEELDKQLNEIKNKKGVLRDPCSPGKEYNRCLECQMVCNICTEVCPNRANIVVLDKTGKNRIHKSQILHIDGMCNECGNCESFCPYDSAPYRDKLTLFWNLEDFEDSRNSGFILLDKASGLFRVRLENITKEISFDSNGNYIGNIPKEIADLIRTIYLDYNYVMGGSYSDYSYVLEGR